MKCDTCIFFDGSCCTCCCDDDPALLDVELCPYYESEDENL